MGEEDSHGVALWVHEVDGVVRRTLERVETTGESTARTEAGVAEVTEVTTAGTRWVRFALGVSSCLTILSAPAYSRLVHHDRIGLGALGGNRFHETAKAHASRRATRGPVSTARVLVSSWLLIHSAAARSTAPSLPTTSSLMASTPEMKSRSKSRICLGTTLLRAMIPSSMRQVLFVCRCITPDLMTSLQLAQKEEAQIYTTDAILSVLMTSTRSVNSWDIVITKEGNNIYLDKREGGPFGAFLLRWKCVLELTNFYLVTDFVTVNENAQDPPADSEKADNINSPGSLSLEATYINSNFASQVVNETKKKAFKNPNPFYSEEENEPLASCAYRYRKFNISVGADEEPVNMVVRTEIDAYAGAKKDESYITIKALNEFDSKAQGSGKAPDWRSKLDAQRGAVIATEMKNNSAKLARWTVQALLAGVDAIKLGFVSRAKPTDAQRHSILLVQTIKPRDVATQMNVSINNGWGIVRMLVDRLRKQEDGRYVLVKDPNAVSGSVICRMGVR